MSDRLTTVFSEYETTDYALALLLSTDGYPLVACTTGSETAYRFRIPEEDLKVYLDECASEMTQVKLRKVIRAKKMLDSVVKKAKNNFNIWTSAKGFYAQRTEGNNGT